MKNKNYIVLGILVVLIIMSMFSMVSAGTGGSPAPKWTDTFIVTSDELDEGYTKELTKKQRLRVRIGEKGYYVGVTDLTDSNVTFEILGKNYYSVITDSNVAMRVALVETQAILVVGEVREFYFEEDSYYGVSIKINSIEDNKANITIKKSDESKREIILEGYVNESIKDSILIKNRLNNSIEGGMFVFDKEHQCNFRECYEVEFTEKKDFILEPGEEKNIDFTIIPRKAGVWKFGIRGRINIYEAGEIKESIRPVFFTITLNVEEELKENITEIINQTQQTEKIFIQDKEVTIEKDSEGISILNTKEISVKSSLEIIEESQKIYIKTSDGNKEFKILPEEAISKIGEIDNIEIKIEEEDGEGVYSISGTKEVKLFFIIPISAEVEQKVNIETGEVISVKKPWWSFLAWGI